MGKHHGIFDEAMTRQEAFLLWEAGTNHHLLETCVGPHKFQLIDSGRWRCTKCGGEVENLHHTWYEQGLLHGAALKRKARPS